LSHAECHFGKRDWGFAKAHEDAFATDDDMGFGYLFDAAVMGFFGEFGADDGFVFDDNTEFDADGNDEVLSEEEEF